MIQKSERFLNKIKAKITKREHAFKGYGTSYNVETLNYFNPEQQLKDIESAIKSKLIELLVQLKGFKFVTTFVLVFKKIENEDKKRMTIFIQTQKQKY